MIVGDRDILIASERVRDLHREAENWRLASSYYRGVSDSGGGGGSGRGIAIRWGLSSDVNEIARVMELNGRPRWEASEERFIVAERDGEIVAAVAARNKASRLALGTVVADPWGGEAELSVEIYRGAVVLARRAGLEGVCVAEGRREYLRRAGYLREIGGWHAEGAPERDRIPAGGFRRILALFGNRGSSRPHVPGL